MAEEQKYSYIPVRITEKVYIVKFFYDENNGHTRKEQMNNAINTDAIKNDLINNEKAIIKFEEYNESDYTTLNNTCYFEVIKIVIDNTHSEIHELMSGIAEENINNYIEEILLDGKWG